MVTDDVAGLKPRIDELESAKSKRRFDGRASSAWAVLIIAALLFPLALTAFWAQRTLTDTERYVATVAPLSTDPSVRRAVSDSVTAALVKQLDVQSTIDGLLSDTPRLQPLAGPITTATNQFVAQQVNAIVESDRFSDVWITLNRRGQESLIKALGGDLSGPVTIQGEQVVLDTGDLIVQVKRRLVDRGLTFVANAPIPPQADREIVILTSPELKRAQSVYAIAQPVAQWLIYVVVALFVLAIALARRRPRMLVAVGVALVLGALAIKLGLTIGANQLQLTLQGTPFAFAEQAFFTILTSFLTTASKAVLALGVVLAIAGWYLSGTRSATAVRRYYAGAVAGAGGRAADGPLAGIGTVVRRYRVPLQIVLAVIAVAVLVLADQITGSLILWTAFCTVVGLAVIAFLAAAGGPSAEPAGGTTDSTAVVTTDA